MIKIFQLFNDLQNEETYKHDIQNASNCISEVIENMFCPIKVKELSRINIYCKGSCKQAEISFDCLGVIECDVPFNYDKYEKACDVEKMKYLIQAFKQGIDCLIKGGIDCLSSISTYLEQQVYFDLTKEYIWKTKRFEKQYITDIYMKYYMNRTELWIRIYNKDNSFILNELLKSYKPDRFIYLNYIKKLQIDEQNKCIKVLADKAFDENSIIYDYSSIISAKDGTLINQDVINITNKVQPKFENNTYNELGIMDEDKFWLYIDALDWKYEGDDDKVIAPVIKLMKTQTDETIFSFDERMAELLCRIDSEQSKRQFEITQGYHSSDDYLDSRCAVIANGKSFFYETLNKGNEGVWSYEFESLLYIPSIAWAQKHKKDEAEYPYITTFR